MTLEGNVPFQQLSTNSRDSYVADLLRSQIVTLACKVLEPRSPLMPQGLADVANGREPTTYI